MITPKIIGHSPAGDPIKSYPFVKPEVAFDALTPIDPSSVQFTLRERDSKMSVVGQWWFRGLPGEIQWLYFEPANLLKPNTYYVASVMAFSIDGIKMPSPYTWTFEVKSK